jgi:outer membrane protein assembly factor BamB
VAGPRDAKLYALDADTGAILWTLGPFTQNVGTPALAGGRVYVNLAGQGLRALDPATGATIWSAAGSPSTALTIANGVLYHGTSSGTLVAHDAATGTVLWSDAAAVHSTSGITAVVVANGAVYASRHTGVTAHHP